MQAQPRVVAQNPVRLVGLVHQGGHGMGDLYFFARKVAALGFSALREAVLVPKLPEAGANVSFWEVTAKNHGLTVQLFDDRQAAMAWLVGGGA